MKNSYLNGVFNFKVQLGVIQKKNENKLKNLKK